MLSVLSGSHGLLWSKERYPRLSIAFEARTDTPRTNRKSQSSTPILCAESEVRPITEERAWIVRCLLLAVIVASAFFSIPAHAQTACNAAPFLAVGSWSGTFTITGTGSGSTTDSNGNVHTYAVNESAQLSPVLTPSPTSPLDYVGAENATVTINDQYTDTPPGGTTETVVYTASGTTATGAMGLGASLSFQTVPLSCGYAFGADESFSPATTTVDGSASASTLSWGTVNIPNLLDQPSTATAPQTVVPFPSGGTTLSGSITFAGDPPWDLPSFFSPSENVAVTWTVNWSFVPTPRAMDLIVTIPNYATWRPTAGTSETSLALDTNDQPNLLTMSAQLVYKDTQQPTTFGPDKVTFSLNSVSHEPGVSMNWPPASQLITPTPPDLSFKDLSGSFPLNQQFTLNTDGTQASYVPPSGSANTTPTLYLLSWDWGGWATLNVTATVGEQTLSGHLQGSSNINIPLPESQPGSHVADIWKTQNNLSLSTPDDDDSETDPQGRSDCAGDGFTLYEEYRGFLENGKRIEGDPHSKDFFIVNDIGADAEPGIFLFTELTGLTVHKDMQKNEVEMSSRPIAVQLGIDPPEGNPIINFNVGQGAFEVQQHGVLLLTCDGIDGGQTLWPSAGPTVGNQIFAADHAQPGITDMICIQSRDAPGAINPDNTHGGSITPVDALLQYDVAVSHELLHSIGVLHHGDRADEGKYEFTLLFPGDPRNTTGKPIFQLQGQNVSILDEQTGQDQAASLWSGLLAMSEKCQAVEANPSAFPSSLASACSSFQIARTDPLTGQLDTFWDDSLWVGEPEGKSSGNDQCVMRYPFSNAYPSSAPLVGIPVFYTVAAGSEPLGFSLCTSPAGTGVNDPDRLLPMDHPQPRYFDARAGRGACQTWMCVNDAYSPAADSQ